MSRADFASDFSSWPLLAQTTKQTSNRPTRTQNIDAICTNETFSLPLPSIEQYKTISINEARFSHILSKPQIPNNDNAPRQQSAERAGTPLKPLLKSIAAHSSKLTAR